MSFDGRDLRPGLDVYSADDVYLGTVMCVIRAGRSAPDPHGRALERGRPGVDGRAVEGSTFSGEAIGPMPTARFGNDGPRRQSAATAYATLPARAGVEHARPPTQLIVLRLLTSLNWSTLRPRLRRIPVNLVQAVAHERIVLSATEAGLES